MRELVASAGECCSQAVSSVFGALRAWGGLPVRAKR